MEQSENIRVVKVKCKKENKEQECDINQKHAAASYRRINQTSQNCKPITSRCILYLHE